MQVLASMFLKENLATCSAREAGLKTLMLQERRDSLRQRSAIIVTERSLVEEILTRVENMVANVKNKEKLD